MHSYRQSNLKQELFKVFVTLSYGVTFGMGLSLILTKGFSQAEKQRCKIAPYTDTHSIITVRSFFGDSSYCVGNVYRIPVIPHEKI